MKISRIAIKHFKRLQHIDLPIAKLTFLVGGNNAGKSSILQGIHTAVTAAQAAVESGETIVSEDRLRYSPTGSIEKVGYRNRLENAAAGHRASVEFHGTTDDDADASYKIELYRGRNYRNVGISREGIRPGFGNHICNPDRLFSVYVPGLAGIPHHEEYQAYATVLRRAAGGEANFVLRNILLELQQQKLLARVTRNLRSIFPVQSLQIQFNPKKDLEIDVDVEFKDGTRVPIDLCGTGLLQAIQLFSYVILFRPFLLLLDEPDSHLHPSNQVQLMNLLETITDDQSLSIVIATHSRHLINSAPSDARFILMRDGSIVTDNENEIVRLLLELGALDSFDPSHKPIVFWTEDANQWMIQLIAQHIGVEGSVHIMSYQGASNFASLQIIKELKKIYMPQQKIIVHRDRDFHIESELNEWREQVKNIGAIPFVTKFADMESYFMQPAHLARISGQSEDDISTFLSELVASNDERLRKEFRAGRQDINKKLHVDGGSPDTRELWKANTKPAPDQIKGKTLLNLWNSKCADKFGQRINPLSSASSTVCVDFAELLTISE